MGTRPRGLGSLVRRRPYAAIATGACVIAAAGSALIFVQHQAGHDSRGSHPVDGLHRPGEHDQPGHLHTQRRALRLTGRPRRRRLFRHEQGRMLERFVGKIIIVLATFALPAFGPLGARGTDDHGVLGHSCEPERMVRRWVAGC